MSQRMEEDIVDYRAQPHHKGYEDPEPNFHHEESCSLFGKSSREACDGSISNMGDQRA